MIAAILAAAVTVTPPVGREPIFLRCEGFKPGTPNIRVGHDVVIDGPRGWIDGRRYDVDLWRGRAFYRLRGPITAPDKAPEPQITFTINREKGSYGATTTHEVLEFAFEPPFEGCTIAKPKF